MLNWMPPRWRKFAIEAFQFLTVGGVSYVVDVGISNLLVFGFWVMPALMATSPLKAKIISTVISVVVSWLGNKLWTYGSRQTGSNLRSMVLFFLVNLAAMVLVLIPGAVSWYLLELHDPISYNISTNVIGIALGMVFRFIAYRSWVFKDRTEHPDRADVDLSDDVAAGTR